MSQQKKSKIIYLDHAATTYMDPRVKEAMDPYFEDVYGNPGSLHQIGLRAREVIDKSKETIAKIINCQSKEIIFTSGGTESINLAIKGVAFRKGEGHIITSKIEHPAVLETCHYLEQKGFKVTYLEVDNNGLIDPKELEKAITKETILITIMYANNEIGTVEPIKEIGEIAKKHKIIFHTDACQAAGALDLDVKKIENIVLSMDNKLNAKDDKSIEPSVKVENKTRLKNKLPKPTPNQGKKKLQENPKLNMELRIADLTKKLREQQENNPTILEQEKFLTVKAPQIQTYKNTNIVAKNIFSLREQSLSGINPSVVEDQFGLEEVKVVKRLKS